MLCSLNIEDSSLEHFSASILINSLTEIWKSLFLTLPSLFSLCPMVPTSCCSLISAQINPRHTWWHFQHFSQFQTAQMELSLHKSSTCCRHGQFDLISHAKCVDRARLLRYCWVKTSIPRQNTSSDNFIFAEQTNKGFSLRLQCHLVLIDWLPCACLDERSLLSPWVNIGQCWCVYSCWFKKPCSFLRFKRDTNISAKYACGVNETWQVHTSVFSHPYWP